MLPESFRSDVLEIIEIAKACPENLQARCLEMLLEHYLSSAENKDKPLQEKPSQLLTPPIHNTSLSSNPDNAEHAHPLKADGTDIVLADLHVKARKFLERSGRTLADVNELFYKDGSEFKPLYDDLRTTKMSEYQIKIALLQALVSGMKCGEFQFDGETVREECQTRKAYDVANFAANFNNSTKLFEGFEKYNKTAPIIRLSEHGRNKLGELMLELK